MEKKHKALMIIACMFLASIRCIILTSSLSQSKNYKEIEPGYNTLRQDSTFAMIYELGRAKYQELSKLIQENKSFEDEEMIIFQQDELIYIFHKEKKVIESVGFGNKIFIYSDGKIDEATF